MRLTGLERRLLGLAATYDVLEEPESAPAVGAAYRRLDAEGLLAAEWWPGDEPPLEAELTAAGRLRLRRR